MGKALFVLLALAGAVCTLGALKQALWSGRYPPAGGWSPRQIRRMKAGRSPWWF